MKLISIQNKIIEAIAKGQDLNAFYAEWKEEMTHNLLKEKKLSQSTKSYTHNEIILQIKEVAEERKQKIAVKSYSYHNEVKQIMLSDITFNVRLTSIFFPKSCKSQDITMIAPQNVAEALFEINDQAASWKNKEWPEYITECKKTAKTRAISEIAIESMLSTKLKGTGISYITEKQKVGVKIYFNIGHNSQIEMTLSHKKFMQQIDGVIDAVQGVKKLMDETNQKIRLKKLDQWRNWDVQNP